LTSANLVSNRAQLRKRLRQQRRALSAKQQRLASEQLARTLLSSPLLFRAKRIAIYLAADGEIDPATFAHKAQQRGKRIYLPSLHPVRKGHLWFGPLQGQRVKNQFGMWEPAPRSCVMLSARELDAVLMPLVGFDDQGGRLGMGGGFYDRTFAYKQVSWMNTQASVMRPKLIGLAHHFQQVTSLPIEPWDVPLQAIATDEQIRVFTVGV